MGTVLAFGDSLAVGVCGAVRGCVSAAVVGWGLLHGDVAQREDRLARSGASRVLISIGTNDGDGGDGYADKLARLRASVPKGAAVTWLMPPSGCGRRLPSHDAIGPLVRDLAAANGDRTIEASTCDPRIRAGDGVHFTAAGYAGIADRWIRSTE